MDTIDPGLPRQQVLDMLDFVNGQSAGGGPLDGLTPQNIAEQWQNREVLARNMIQAIPARVRQVCVPARNHQVPMRLYTPEDTGDPPLPILLFVHGGGWTIGSIATYDSIARKLASDTGALVALPEYRLAPEYPYPAGLDDVELALHWLLRNAADIGGNAARLAVAGDSGGATLATALILRIGQREAAWNKAQYSLSTIRFAFQFLFYPSTDLSRLDRPSYHKFGKGYWLTTRSVELFRGFYALNPIDWSTNGEVSPLLAPQAALEKMPPTFLMTAGCCPLQDEGEAYAQRLRDCGVTVHPWNHPNIAQAGAGEWKEPGVTHAVLNLFNNNASPQFNAVSPLAEDILKRAAARIGPKL